MHRLLFTVKALLLLVPIVQPVMAATAQEDTVSCELRFFYWPNRLQSDVLSAETGEFRDTYQPPPEITLHIPTSSETLEIPTAFNSGTRAYTYNGPRHMPVYLASPQPDENGVLPPPDARVDLGPYGQSAFILMRVNIDTGKTGFFPIAENSAKAPPGSYTLVNISGKDVAVKLNDSVFVLKDRSAQNKLSDKQARYDDLSIVVGDENDYKVVSKVKVPRPKTSRYLVFVQDENGNGNIGIDIIAF